MRVLDLKSIVLAPIDFDSETPDQEKKHAKAKPKENINTAGSREKKQKSKIEGVNDWLDSSEELSLELTIFALDTQT
jgi:hypothetical protein